jgi:hypothetical protein
VGKGFAIAKKEKENSRRKFLWQDLPESEKRIVGWTVEMVRTQGVGGWEKTAPSGASAAAMVWTVCRFVKSSIVKRTEAEI